MALRDEELQHLVEGYVERGVVESADTVWSEVEPRVRALLESRAAFVHEIHTPEAQRVKHEIHALDKQRESLIGDLARSKRAAIEGWRQYYKWGLLVLWIGVVIGEAGSFPLFYRDVFDVSLWIGAGFAAVFVAASMILHGLLYERLGERGKRRFCWTLLGFWGMSVLSFVLSFLPARGALQQQQRAMSALALSGAPVNESLTSLYTVSLISLWFLGLTTATGLMTLQATYRNPKRRIEFLEGELQTVEAKVKEARQEHMAHTRAAKEGSAMVERDVLAVKNALRTGIQKETEKRDVLRRYYPELFASEIPPANGKAKATTIGGLLLVLTALLGGPTMAAAAPEIVFVQDVSRPSQAVEQEFQSFGKLVLGLPAGSSITLFGSDGTRQVTERLDGTHQGALQRQRQAVLEQGRAFYQRLRNHPLTIRDYATVLAEILPRLGAEAIVIMQGRPLYRLDPINWDERIPSLSWAFHPASPFGEKALEPAPARFRVAIVFAPDDFVSPNHRTAVYHVWRVLLHRLNGDLVLFTTDGEAITGLLSRAGSIPNGPRPVLPSDTERYAPLKLEGAQRLGVSE